MNIEFLTSEWESEYEKFLMEGETTLFYHSNSFRKFLKHLLQVEDYYLLATKNGKIMGALPAVLSRRNLGKSLNSLAFFGSNGGVIEFEGSRQVRDALLNGFYNLGKKMGCLSATLIGSPFDKNRESDIYYDYLDERMGQITDIRVFSEKKNDIDNFGLFTRRMIRKATRHSIKVEINNGKNAFDFLKERHYENMDEIGGEKKPPAFFSAVKNHLREGREYNLWMAYKDSDPIAAMLLFYFNRTVEYYIPAIIKEYRSIQPSSLLIFEAMKDAAKKGYFYWNWGGTHLDQDGVYRFKKQWNTVNVPYYYYIKVYDEKLFTYSKEVIKKEFPYCYLLPFNKLRS
ncbi:MAG: peptidoglycan bridge formation glycyltransferase FemA/FemB family protein [Bacteroidales bacterium]|nr:peptidoglycan bridge formation glycyltransferase FemA/FemB family protein [Bacteroidales bacterium]